MLLGVDTGGTFTDFVLITQEGIRVHKRLSTPHAPATAIIEGLQELNLMPAAKSGQLTIVHGSTVATNATLEGKGVKTAFITNRGLSDMLSIGRQTRDALYDLCPYPKQPPVPKSLCLETGGRLDPLGKVVEPLTEADIETLVEQIEQLQPEAVAINLLYSFIDDRFEKAIESALLESASLKSKKGQSVSPEPLFVSRSSYVLPEYKEYERGIATWLNASLGPIVANYLTQLDAALSPCPIRIMQSSGGTMNVDSAAKQAVRLLLSGPAGGLAAAQFIGRQCQTDQLITFDMGGTSTDVALIDQHLTLTNESRIGSYPVAVPMVDMHTIGAGGGSIAFRDQGGLLQVGPHSAGSEPGPACYGRGGMQATVTDANVVLGRLRPALFLGGQMSLDAEKAEAAVRELAASLQLDLLETAFGIISIANDHMSRALRVISVQRGYDPKKFQLCSFGGAGGLHVCALADALQIPKAIIPINGGVLSALGMLVAPRERQLSITHQCLLSRIDFADLDPMIHHLEKQGQKALVAEGVDSGAIQRTVSFDLRYQGQTHTLNIAFKPSIDNLIDGFHQEHKARYGHALHQEVELVNIRVGMKAENDPIHLPRINEASKSESIPTPIERVPLHYLAHHPHTIDTAIFQRDQLKKNQIIQGPALVVETVSTTLIDFNWTATVDKWGNLLLERLSH